MGDDFVDMPKEQRTEDDKQQFAMWCNLLKWYLLLKRTGINPTFDESRSDGRTGTLESSGDDIATDQPNNDCLTFYV
jgi:hypothetical protein